MPKKAVADRSLEERLLRGECPALYELRTWLLSRGIPFPARQRPHWHMVIELDGGACLAAHFGLAALDQHVAVLLDGLLEDPMEDRRDSAGVRQPPARGLTDNKTDVHLATLATWGLARGVQAGCHPACTLHLHQRQSCRPWPRR